ncbi:MAG: hypothetical protein HGA76_00495 [Candidatus Firestonebacteria bacterium]|nr:hypothetical protein [Candidatus Firestonebacteria bacterium]
MAVSFLFPAMSWAFQIQAYDMEPGMAAAPAITPNLGKVISANRGTAGTTLYLIQDLHCNYEVQGNIRRLLGELTQKNPDLKLIAVEGATGIIPTRALADFPDTPGKQAVADYFMREGKLTGADVLAICDRPQVELFGAENRGLYAQSLSLIRDFVTDGNRGLVLELADQIKLLQARYYNPQLLAFEKRREAMLQGRMDVRAYHGSLIREALKYNILSGLEAFGNGSRSWGLYESALLDRELETKLRARLLKTSNEKKLLEYALYLETAEHILSVSASQAEIDAYLTASRNVSLTAIQKYLVAECRKLKLGAGEDAIAGEDMTALEKSMQQGLVFYQLAGLRNRALLEKTAARLRVRGEQQAVLVAGGFHTEGIAQQARAQGWSVVVVRPRQVDPAAANNYFLRLRYPDQPTELERLVASWPASGNAIAPSDELLPLSFRLGLIQAFKKVQAVFADGKARSNTMERRSDGIVKLSLPRGSGFYLTVINGKLYVDRNIDRVIAFRQAENLKSLPPDGSLLGVLGSPLVRTASLAVLGVGALLYLAAFSSALMPVLLALGSAGLVAWSLASFTNLKISDVLTWRNAVAFTLMIGALFSHVFGGAVFSDFITQLNSSLPAPTGNHLSFLGSMVENVLKAASGIAPLKALLTVQAAGSIDHGQVLQDFGQVLMAGLPFFGSTLGDSQAQKKIIVTGLEVPNRIADLAQKSYPETNLGDTQFDLEARQALARFKVKIEEIFGAEGVLSGAYQLMTPEEKGTVAHYLSLLGQGFITGTTNLNINTLDFDIDNMPDIVSSPALSRPIINKPENGRQGKIINSIYMIFPRFVRFHQRGRDVTKEVVQTDGLPREYIEGVIDSFLINKLLVGQRGRLVAWVFKHIYSDEVLEDLKQTILEGNSRFEDKSTRPFDYQALIKPENFLFLMFVSYFHEDRHGKNLHIPEILSNFENLVELKNELERLDRVGDNSAKESREEELSQIYSLQDFEFARILKEHPEIIDQYRNKADRSLADCSLEYWRKMWKQDEALTHSMVNYKNSVKAAQEVAMYAADKRIEYLDTLIRNWWDLENQNDRGSIFDYEIGEKSYWLQRIFKIDLETYTLNDELLMEVVFKLDEARAKGTLEDFLSSQYGDVLEKKNISVSDVAKAIETAFSTTEKKHPFISLFHDPPLRAWEREFFKKNALLVKKLDASRQAGNFDAYHFYLSRNINITRALRKEWALAAGLSPAVAAFLKFAQAALPGVGAFSQLLGNFFRQNQPESMAVTDQSESSLNPNIVLAENSATNNMPDENSPMSRKGAEMNEILDTIAHSKAVKSNSHLSPSVVVGFEAVAFSGVSATHLSETSTGLSAIDVLTSIKNATTQSRNGVANLGLKLDKSDTSQVFNGASGTFLGNENSALFSQSGKGVTNTMPRSAAVGTAPLDLPSTQRANSTGTNIKMSTATAPIAQATTRPQMNAANQALAAGRAAALLPSLLGSFLNLWNSQPVPPPKGKLPSFTFMSNDPYLLAALASLVSGSDLQGGQGANSLIWTNFVQALRLQLIDLSGSGTGVKGGSGASPSGFTLAQLSGNKNPDSLLQAFQQAVPASLPAQGSVNGMIAITPGQGTLGFDFSGEQNGVGFSTGNGAVVAGADNAALKTGVFPGQTAVVYEDGTIRIPIEVIGIPINQFSGKSIPENIQSFSNNLKTSLDDQSKLQYRDLLLLTREQMEKGEVKDLLGNFNVAEGQMTAAQVRDLEGNFNLSAFPVRILVDSAATGLLQTQLGAQGYQRMLTLRQLIDGQAAQFKAAFAAGAQAVSVALDTLSPNVFKQLAASLVGQGNNKLLVFGSGASSMLSKEAAFSGLSAIGKNLGLATTHAGSTQALAEEVWESSLTRDLDLLEAAMNAQGTQQFEDLSELTTLAGRQLSKAEAREFTEHLGVQDSVICFSTNAGHARGVEQGKSQLSNFSGFQQLLEDARATDNPDRVYAGAEAIPEKMQTKFLTFKGFQRFFSWLALGVAAFTLTARSLWRAGSVLDAKGFKAQRLPIFSIVIHPKFLTALYLMAKIVTGRYGNDPQDPMLRQQLADLSKLEKTLREEGGRLEDLKVGDAKIPASLRYSFTHLVWLKNFLTKIRFMDFLKFRHIDLNALNPELLMLVDQVLGMDKVAWYFAKQTYMLKQVEAHQELDPTLRGLFMLSSEDMKNERQRRVAELQELNALTNLEATQAGRIETLRRELRDLHFVRRFQDQLAKVDQSKNAAESARLVRSLLTTLVVQLSRKDVSPRYADSLLVLISLLDPDNQTLVQMTAVREREVKTLILNMPDILRTSPMHLEMFMRTFPLLYDDQGKQIMPMERNRIISALRAA